ncbi:hypothetical protein CYMTET_23189 [Cymbomonas tetramitiformis]|uniref:Sirohydrochlorin ferrochelatase n=1 Tax=Cymbomonas tetramitiformis TaxID=36881 RepID=A0AAE0FYP0_9CHLO|nr:hypothetical protein CYMTET_23189 [Cymbomonas tetramitiformis]
MDKLAYRTQLSASAQFSRNIPTRLFSASDGHIVEETKVGAVIVDHGSRREASNDLLLEFANIYQKQTGREIVEPAHMELAPPSIADAFDKCVARGANTVLVIPYFLSPGRHWQQDIPRLAAEAAEKHPGVEYLVSAPIGLHSLVAQVLDERVEYCLKHIAGESYCFEEPIAEGLDNAHFPDALYAEGKEHDDGECPPEEWAVWDESGTYNSFEAGGPRLGLL